MATASPRLDTRRRAYSQMSSGLAALNDDQLRRLVRGVETPHIWGTTGSVNFGSGQVFVKRKPVTTLELEQGRTTRNLYRLPMACNYGVGSPGFGVRREVVSSIAATNWVLEGEIERFPLLYHHRTIALQNKKVNEPMDGLAGFVKYWGNSKGVERVMEARSRATHEVILVFEYVPNVASSWLVTHPTDLAKLNDNGAEIFEHLRNHGIAHLDSHLSNFLTDGTEFYLTDFELSLSPAFELSTQERSFLKEHRYYDQAELLAASCNVVHAFYQAATESQRAKVRERFEGIEQLSLRPRCSLLLEHLDEVRRLLALPRSLVSFAEKHQDLAYLFNDFLFRLASSNSKRAKLDHEAVDAALINAGLTQIFEAK